MSSEKVLKREGGSFDGNYEDGPLLDPSSPTDSNHGNGKVPHDDPAVECTLPIPPDGGWGWMIVFASFMIHVIADGVAYSFGVFLEDFSDYFDSSHASTSLLSSLMIGVTWGSGPIVSALTNMYGCRTVTILGSFIASFGFVISIFAPNIIFMYISFGVISGLGLGLIFVPAIVSVSFYFEKRRSFATGIAVCGSGIGTFIFGPLTELMLQHYGSWKCAVLIDAGLLLNCAVCGCLFRPLPSPLKKKKEVAQSKEVLLKPGDVERQISSHSAHNFLTSQSERRHSTLSLPQNALHNTQSETSGLKNKRLALQPAQNSTSDFYINKAHHRRAAASHSTSHHHIGPLSRKDIFYSGSLRNFPLFNANPQEYTRSITSLPAVTAEEPDESNIEEASQRISCWQKIKKKLACKDRSWKEILDFTIFRDPVYNMFVVSNIFTSLGFCVPYVFLPDRARLNGYSRKQGAFLISIVGISNTVGRVVFGFISDRKGVNRLMLYNTVVLLCGLATILSSLCTTFPLMALYSALFGCFLGVYVSITSVVLVDLLGLEKLTSSFGLLLMFQGIAAVLGPPIAGWVYDATNDYDISFYLMGSMIAISGIMLYPIPILQRRQRNKHKPLTQRGEMTLDVSAVNKPTVLIEEGSLTTAETSSI